MNMKDIEELVKEFDSQDMVGYTRKFIDDFSYRETQESLAPTGAVVSKKRNRGFGRQVSFGSRRKR